MKKLLCVLLVMGITLGACSSGEEAVPQVEEEAIPVSGHADVDVQMINSEGKEVGKAALKETVEGVQIHLQAKDLEPGIKAIHIHETGVCEAPDFTSAGAHFNPGKKEHGFENPKGFHIGDLPNIGIEDDGTVNVVITAPNVTLKEGEEGSLLDEDGSALVIHEKADDYKTDPAGNAGDRIVCGVIGGK
ncbi:superoxide dismutase family protein [Bacillus sp. SD088]|uniref:superoxide dismutase family protein n=1 Tax=Bacillus sp. SD088 TaxID=2782012 RepID=UPI001A964FD1|nr:superoxide dismutase family protein [Bacillus sp. SD088]MBO0993872.1 superoxide dismutase family protein [Bacillus sp. SD088]